MKKHPLLQNIPVAMLSGLQDDSLGERAPCYCCHWWLLVLVLVVVLSYWLCVIVNVLVAAVANTVLVGFDIPSNMSCCGFVFLFLCRYLYLSLMLLLFSLFSLSPLSPPLSPNGGLRLERHDQTTNH